MKQENIFISYNKKYIIDCRFESIKDPWGLEVKINNIPGVVENGLFLGMTDVVIMGTEDGEKLFSKPL